MGDSPPASTPSPPPVAATRWLGIGELGRLLRAGDVSATDLARAALERLDTTGRRLNAVATLTADLALDQAARADGELRAGTDRGPLHGIPWGAKDLLATRGIPTTWGAAPFRDQVPAEDAAVVERMAAAGAVLIGKLAMVELAGGFNYDQPDAAWTGPGRNAWDPETWAGGSSSGSGSAVGCGAVPVAIGSETWGSIHTPAALNGITGFRPTYGRVSRRGAMALSWTMDKVGPMARSAGDAWLTLRAIAGPDPGDRTSADRSLPDLPTGHGFRLAVPRGVTDGLDTTLTAAFERALDVLRPLAASIEEIDLPDLPWAETAALIIAAEGASAFQDQIEDGTTRRLSAPEDRYGLYHALTMPASDYIRALRVRGLGMTRLAAVMRDIDAVVAPTLPVEAPPIDASFRVAFAETGGIGLGAPGNLCGLPSITVPMGSGPRGLPVGIEFLGNPWSEPTLAALAIAFQSATDWHLHHPPDRAPTGAT
ncbi:MAG: amidase [Chloroflexia bacterium]|nr:amidase [Chloroflexia bacterium]